MTRPLTLTAALLLTATAARAEPMLPAFDAAAFAPHAAITHPYFPLAPGFSRRFTAPLTDAEGDPGEESFVLSFGGPGPILLGVQTTVMLDQAYEDGLLVEETRDFYAQDRAGNVWYMGEDVTNLTYDDEDRVTGTNSHSSWRAGVNGALPGHAMPAAPLTGLTYFQEHAAADEALDQGEVMATDLTLTTPTGPQAGVIAIYESSSLEPELQEIKYYAPGIGLIRAEEGVDATRANPALTFDLQAQPAN